MPELFLAALYRFTVHPPALCISTPSHAQPQYKIHQMVDCAFMEDEEEVQQVGLEPVL